MTKIYVLLLLSLAVVITVACENEIPFNPKANPPKLIMNAFINADSLHNTLFLNMSGQNQLGDVTDATVEVRVNGQLTETAQLLPKKSEYEIGKRFRINTAFHPGDAVRIDATTADGHHHTWVEVVVPQPIAIEKWDTATAYFKRGGFQERYMRYKITFSDRPKEDNYYRLIAYCQTNVYERLGGGKEKLMWTYKSTEMVSREDVVLTDGHPSTSDENTGLFEKENNIYGIFDDSRFRDGSYTMTVYIPNPQYDIGSDSSYRYEVDVYFLLLSITETEFRYLKALNIIDSDVYDETIMEPIKYASNVNGGLGIVGINAGTCKKINILK